ncbi:MAG: glycosyltransferase [Patescibacteria group bacterium]
MTQKEQHTIVIVAHKLTTQPDDDLVIYLNKKRYPDVLHICHSFSDAPDRRSWFTWYKNGKVFKEQKTKDYKHLPEPMIYLKEWYFTWLWVLQSRQRWDRYIGMDGLCVFFGNVLRKVGLVRKTIYWAIDFVPNNRFTSQIKNKIYHFINIQGYKDSDEMWDLSPRMKEAREKYLGIKQTIYRSHKVVPYGTWIDRIKKYSFAQCDKNTVVFMGHLIEKQGAQLLIEAIPGIIKKNPNFRFKIIGGGQYKEQLIELAKKLHVLKYCDFRGKIPDHKVLEDEIAKSAVAVAPYIKKLDTWTYYADPGKVKTYLACGVPVLLTDLPWNAKEIEKDQCGEIITEKLEDIQSSVLDLMRGEKNQKYRDNAIVYAQNFNYTNIFDGVSL